MRKNTKNWKDKEEFKEFIHQWAEKLDVSIVQIRFRSMKNKWASCSTAGRTTFDTELLGIDKKLGEYVIVHELLHIRIPNHGKLFKNLLYIYIPDWMRRKEKLMLRGIR